MAFIISFFGILTYNGLHLLFGYVVMPYMLAINVRFHTATQKWVTDNNEVRLVDREKYLRSMELDDHEKENGDSE